MHGRILCVEDEIFFSSGSDIESRIRIRISHWPFKKFNFFSLQFKAGVFGQLRLWLFKFLLLRLSARLSALGSRLYDKGQKEWIKFKSASDPANKARRLWPAPQHWLGRFRKIKKIIFDQARYFFRIGIHFLVSAFNFLNMWVLQIFCCRLLQYRYRFYGTVLWLSRL